MIDTVFRLLLRLIVLAMGLVFMGLLLMLALAVLGWWLLRALWARLTGRPVAAWQFDFKRYASRYPFQAAGRRQADDVVDVDVIDVEARPAGTSAPPSIESDKRG
jgi:hypothetical protein